MRYIFAIGIATLFPALATAQSAVDAMRFSQNDLKGTARYMSMAGAFGALGGDLSSLSQNPAGIGVYRSNDIGFTLDLDCQSSNSNTMGFKANDSQTKFLLNNIGAVFTLKLPSNAVPNLNFGFTYNKAASFNRVYSGKFNQLSNSMSNYIAAVSNSENLTVPYLTTTDTYDPYYPNDGGYAAPWISILGYDSYLINPNGDDNSPHWTGQWGDKTSGQAIFSGIEKGGIDEYNIAIGGNISNVVYWGMNFDIINFNYSINAFWNESLSNAEIEVDGKRKLGSSDWDINNFYKASGSGFNYQLGVIVKPIQELRLGFAFHTPTWYNLTESYIADTHFIQNGKSNYAVTNNGILASNYINFRSPWKIIASAAGVIGSNFIISAEYEWDSYNNMKFYEDSSDSWGYDWDYWNKPMTKGSVYDPYYETNKDINKYYQATHTFRLGAEYRVTPQFSVRAGYSYVTSPVRENAKNDKEVIYTSGTLPSYRMNNETNYITCGAGYRYQKFYVDLAYVYKHLSSEYHAYTPDPRNPQIPSPQSDLSFSNNQIVLTCGLRF